ncbi:MFS transporter [bacterium]|nr:MFS transporter [bacterium]RQV95509.1 MAG: MFS transporter [bacterium]
MTKNPEKNRSVPSTPSYAWVILVVVVLASVAAPLNQMKVSPVLSFIMEYFDMSLSLSGYLNSVFAFTRLILALPTGIFLKRFGPKIMGIIALSCLAVGAVLVAVSQSPGMLIFSRVIEGNGLGLMSVIVPAAVSMWFPAEKRGIPMGIWATWFPVGSIIMYVFAPVMTTSLGWQIIALMTFTGIIAGAVPTATFAAAPEIMKKPGTG